MANRKIRICLKELLLQRNMTQVELSRLSGVREEVISKMCNQKYKRVEIVHIECILRALDIVDMNLFLKFGIVDEEEEADL